MKNRKNAAVRKPEILENYYQVIIEEGIEGASIGKTAKRIDCHPSLLIHYFKTKRNMTLELCDLLLEKYLASEYLEYSHISNLEDRFNALIDTIFTESWSKTVDPGVQFCFYYLSFRNSDIRKRFNIIFKRFRDYLYGEMEIYKRAGIINVKDLDLAIDTIIILMEGLEFHSVFLANGKPFEEFAEYAKKQVLALLKGTTAN